MLSADGPYAMVKEDAIVLWYLLHKSKFAFISHIFDKSDNSQMTIQ